MANSSDIAQSDLAELLTILGMGNHARPQSPHEVFQEALGVLRQRLVATEHWSDCAVHNEPALPAGPCNRGGASRFKLVPKEPTDGMQQDGLAALEAAICTHGKPTLPGFAAAHVYRAMLAAAPVTEAD